MPPGLIGPAELLEGLSSGTRLPGSWYSDPLPLIQENAEAHSVAPVLKKLEAKWPLIYQEVKLFIRMHYSAECKGDLLSSKSGRKCSTWVLSGNARAFESLISF